MDTLDLLRRLRFDRWFFTQMYRRGTTPWDTGISPPELVEAIAGPEALPPGRALDLGCGTGTNCVYLAQHGWQATGVDFAAPAIARANERIRQAGTLTGSARFVQGDVSRLETLHLGTGYTFALDLGCLHGMAAARRPAYASGLASVTAPGALYLLYAFAPRLSHGRQQGIAPDEVRALFAPAFTIERAVQGTDAPRRAASAWYWLHRGLEHR